MQGMGTIMTVTGLGWSFQKAAAAVSEEQGASLAGVEGDPRPAG